MAIEILIYPSKVNLGVTFLCGKIIHLLDSKIWNMLVREFKEYAVVVGTEANAWGVEALLF